MGSEWIIRISYPGVRTLDQLTQLENDFEATDIDVSVAAQPQIEQWTLTAGSFAESGMALFHELQRYLVKFDIHDDPLAIEFMTLAEYERRADEPTLPVLVGSSEVAEILGVSRQRVHQLRTHPGFPSPLVEVAMGPLWDERAVEAFARDWARKPGRPSAVSS